MLLFMLVTDLFPIIFKARSLLPYCKKESDIKCFLFPECLIFLQRYEFRYSVNSFQNLLVMIFSSKNKFVVRIELTILLSYNHKLWSENLNSVS